MRRLPLVEVHTADGNCVRRVPIFSRLSPEQQDTVASYARPVTLAKGELLHAAGQSMGQLFVVHAGQLKVVHTAPSGREHLIRVAESGDVVGEHAFLTGARPEHHVEALTNARLCVFAHADLARLVATYPSIAMSMLRSLSDRLAEAERRLALNSVDVDVRVASYLLDLPIEHREGTRQIVLPLPKKDIAALLSTTPESLSRALARLQRNGLLRVDGDSVALLNPVGLEDLAQGW